MKLETCSMTPTNVFKFFTMKHRIYFFFNSIFILKFHNVFLDFKTGKIPPRLTRSMGRNQFRKIKVPLRYMPDPYKRTLITAMNQNP